MPVESNFDMAALKKYAESKKDDFIEAAVEAYKITCIEAVRRAKQTNTYKDQTHRLRSSIGCVLYHDGVEVYNYFESTGGEAGGEGVQLGLTQARNLAELQGNKSIVAVLIAGAHYAVYVEAKGYDVLTGSTLRFTDDLKEEFSNIQKAFKEHVKGKFNL